MKYKDLANQIINCTKCPLSETRHHSVVGDGDLTSKILFVGEAPGKNEDLQGIPFVGASGQLFNSYLDILDLTRKDIYLTNVVKCRPPQNRDPKPDEVQACIPYLRMQYRMMSPAIVVCLGRVAAGQLMKKDIRIMREHGTFLQKNDTWFMATLHPSALLRNPDNRPLVLNDMLIVKEKMKALKII